MAKPVRRAAVILFEQLKMQHARALTALGHSHMACILPSKAVVVIIAALDMCYYALLEHSLICKWPAGGLPPPHVYFSAMAAAHPGMVTRSW